MTIAIIILLVLLAYGWGGYPLLLAVVARPRRVRGPGGEAGPNRLDIGG
jgi:hypothetical protein